MAKSKGTGTALPSEADLRIRAADLKETIDAIEAETTPLRQERDALLAEYEPQVRKLEAEYLKKEEGLYYMKMEYAGIARFLKGRLTEPEVAAEAVAEEAAKA